MSSSKQKLCIVNPYEHGGGAEYQLSLLIDAVVAAGRYEVHFLTRFPDARERTRNYQVHQIGDGGPIPRPGYLMDAPALYRKLRELDPCVIYQRVACAYTGICAAYSRHRSTPLLWHVAHDTEVSRSALDPARNILRLYLEKWAVAFGARRATAVICQTQHQADLLQENFGRAAAAVVPNFHPPATESIDKSGPLTVLWIANLKPWKRPEAFVRLAQQFRADEKVRFIMVGAPVEGARNQAWQESLMRSINDTANLQYLGPKSHREVNELLARAHIFVNTSTHEGFPNTFVQAWLRDVVVTSLSVDPDQVLEREKAGILAHSESGLYAAVRQLIDDAEVREAYAKRGRDHANACNSLRNAQVLIGLIDRYGGSRG